MLLNHAILMGQFSLHKLQVGFCKNRTQLSKQKEMTRKDHGIKEDLWKKGHLTLEGEATGFPQNRFW